ncbi:hypothetical protein [Streptomyces roseolilacinus]|uniref:hypothetical protein n=1 Tax=Streptomyces roseolilacinus TaxID=66904 RepID=UPI0038007CEB
MSGSDLQHIARWTAMSRLLAGRTRLRVAGDGEDHVRAAAATLRASAKAWHEAVQAWHRVVDTTDPRAHPSLPPPSYELVRLGKVVRLPQTFPHPAAEVAHTAVVRVGQLLYGAHWRPAGTAPGEGRPPSEILADAGGTAALAAALYRLPGGS